MRTFFYLSTMSAKNSSRVKPAWSSIDRRVPFGMIFLFGIMTNLIFPGSRITNAIWLPFPRFGAFSKPIDFSAFYIQFSHLSFGTRENSLMLLETIVKSRLKAWAAISISRGPIVLPFDSSKVLISP